MYEIEIRKKKFQYMRWRTEHHVEAMSMWPSSVSSVQGGLNDGLLEKDERLEIVNASTMKARSFQGASAERKSLREFINITCRG